MRRWLEKLFNFFCCGLIVFGTLCCLIGYWLSSQPDHSCDNIHCLDKKAALYGGKCGKCHIIERR